MLRLSFWAGYLNLYIRRISSNFDVIIIVSTNWFKFRRKNIAFRRNFDGLLQNIPIAPVCFNHLFQFHSLKHIS